MPISPTCRNFGRSSPEQFNVFGLELRRGGWAIDEIATLFTKIVHKDGKLLLGGTAQNLKVAERGRRQVVRGAGRHTIPISTLGNGGRSGKHNSVGRSGTETQCCGMGSVAERNAEKL